MFELLVLFFIASVFVALFLMIALFGLRVFAAVKYKGSILTKLSIALLPAGIGYHFHVQTASAVKRLYIVLTVAMFFFAVIGAVWITFVNIPRFAAWFFYG